MSFTLDSFEQYFNSTILKRGQSYYMEGAVASLKEENGTWLAEVHGSTNYTVNVRIVDNQVISADCNCPFDQGSNCKHEAAVLYAIRDFEDQVEAPQKAPIPQKEDSIKKILSVVKEKQLRDSLYSLSAQYQDVRHFLLTSFSHLLPPSEAKKHSKELIQSMVKSVKKGAYGFIDYHACSKLGYDAYKLIASPNQYDINTIYLNVEVIAQLIAAYVKGADDSSGEFGMAINKAFENLSTCIQESVGTDDEAEIKNLLFKIAIREFKKEKYQGFDWEYDWINLAAETIDSSKKAQKLVQLIEELIIKKSELEYSMYSIEKLSYSIYLIYKEWESPEVAEQFLNQNLDFKTFRTTALQIAFENNEDEKVKQLVNDGLKKEKDKSFLHWETWLINLAKKNGDTDTQAQLLEKAYFQYPSIQYLNQLKECLPENEFKKKVEIYINYFQEKGDKNYFNSAVANIYQAENRLEDLLNLVKANPRLSLLDEYYKILATKSPEDYTHLYGLCADEAIAEASNRKEYKRICKYLTKMTEIGGLESAQILRQEWKEKYKRRPALTDELDKLAWSSLKATNH